MGTGSDETSAAPKRGFGGAPILAALGAVLMLALAPAAWAKPVQPPAPQERTERVLSKVEFRDRMIRRLAELTPPMVATAVSEEELKLTGRDGQGAQLFLGNAYRMYLDDPAGLEDVLGKFARLADGMGVEEKLEVADLRILIRSQDYLTFLSNKAAAEGRPYSLDDQPLQRRMSGRLVALVAQDRPESYAYPVRKDVRAVVPDDADSWAKALANTRAALGEILTEEVDDGVLIVTTSNGLGVSLMLFDDVWSRKDLAGKGAPVVALIDRNTLVLAHEGEPENVAGLRRLVDSLAREPDAQTLTDALLVLRDSGWEVLPR